MEQIQVTQLDNKHDDLFVVNAARTSFNKWSKVFHPTPDTRLINYLAREQHSSPFRHVRMAIAFQLSTLCGLPDLNFLDPFDRAGLVTSEVQWNGGTYLVMKNSLFGWANLIRKWGHLYSEFFNKFVGYQLYQHFPVSAKALGVPIPIGLLSARDLVGAYVLPEKELATLGEPWLVDVSFRCKVPIWLSRQLAKHQVGMSWNECFSADTEVLTNKGWILWPNVTAEHKIATPTLDGSDYFFEKPEALYVNNYHGKLLHIYSRDIDMLVTPGHDQYISYYQGANGPWSAYQKMPTLDALKTKFPKTMQVPQLSLPEGNDYWEGKLYGAFIGDGSISIDGERIYFHVKKERKKKMLRELAEATPEYGWNENKQSDGYSYFRIYNKQGWVGDVATKRITFYKSTKSFYKGILHGLVATDGCISKSNNSVSYSTVSELLVKDLETLAFIMGFDITTHIRERQGNWNKVYKMTFKLPRPKLLKYSEEVNYTGKVYCAKTSTGLLIVRRNGKSCVSGNCSRRYISTQIELFNQEVRHAPDGSIKQGSGPVCEHIPPVRLYGNALVTMDAIMQGLLDWYNEAVDRHLAPETLRGFMPQNMMTEYIWSGPLSAFAHMVNLRSEGHAQKEAQDFARKISAQLHLTHPDLWSNLLK